MSNNKQMENTTLNQLIKLYEDQITQLTLMSKIELGDDVIEEINKLKSQLQGGEMMMERNTNNNPGDNNTSGNNTVIDLMDEHFIIRETVGYEFLNTVAIEDIPEVIKFLKVIFNFTKMNNVK